MTLFFAHDGSIHADWISHYAIRLAARLPAPELTVLSVRDGELRAETFERRIEAMSRACEQRSIKLHTRVLERTSAGVADTLLSALPSGSDHYLVCGTRTEPRGRGVLAGTVSERLLASHSCHVLALRVVQPGFLGEPRELLVPVSGHPRGVASGLPFLRLLAPQVERLQLLFVEYVRRRRFRTLTHEAARAAKERGRRYLTRVTAELEDLLPAEVLRREVVVSDDVPKEILLAANRVRAQLLYLGAAEESAPRRYGSPLEQILRQAPCDVAIYRAAR